MEGDCLIVRQGCYAEPYDLEREGYQETHDVGSAVRDCQVVWNLLGDRKLSHST